MWLSVTAEVYSAFEVVGAQASVLDYLVPASLVVLVTARTVVGDVLQQL